MTWAIGHHLPGMMRAYGDPALFRRFRWRFILAPVLLLAACGFSLMTGVSSGLLGVAAIWGWWHYLMQTYGFCRIYDAKVGSFAPTTRWLDQAMCLCWFAAAVVLNDNTLYGFVEHLYNSGIPVPSTRFFELLRSVISGATAGVTVLFLGHVIRRWGMGEPPNVIKLAVMASTFACFWYSAATVTNIVVAYAFFELFHDAQYLTIVWAFNRRRVEKDPELRGFTRWLFQPRLLFVGLYVALIVGYGSLKWGSTYVTADHLQRGLTALFLTSTLLHYYFDGFIWKLRDASTQTTLGIEASAVARARWRMPLGLRHALLWSLFIVPFAYLSIAQVERAIQMSQLDEPARFARQLAESEQLATAMPGSFRAHFTIGLARELAGQLDQAAAAYEETLRRCPGFEPAEAALRRVHSRRQPTPPHSGPY
jgi:hypothetical protein